MILDLFARALVLGGLGFLLLAFIAIVAGPGGDEDEEFPEDPDRARDWAVADEMEVL